MVRLRSALRASAGIAILASTVAVAADAAETRPSIEDLAWLAGAWSGEQDGVLAEEHWMEPRGGLMPGLHRDVRPGQPTHFEFLRIEEGADGIVYHASPQGAPPTPFKLRSLEERRVVFENLEHDFPQRILYWIDAEGLLHARVEGDGGASMEWRWKRAR
jgi:hypothetical protein